MIRNENEKLTEYLNLSKEQGKKYRDTKAIVVPIVVRELGAV